MMAKIVDARSGQLVEIGQLVQNSDDPADWYTVRAVRFRTLLSRTVTVERNDGSIASVPAPVRFFPRLAYGASFPTNAPTVIYPS